ncbi:MAG: L,D-transpeptidase, partial [Anaerolineae bacterium]|nr:L,D-transpeptidase [Anaerolineae bacterium]
MRPRRKRLVVIVSVSVAAAVVVCCLTGWGWRIVDVCIWRAMVIFKVPITPADDGYRIVVDKSDHRLSLYKDDELLRAYPIAISHAGLDARRHYDDLLTPEGEFLIASMQYTSVFGPRQMLLETTAQALADYQSQYGD